MKLRLTDDISIAARSPGLEADAIEVVVTIPTFRRPDHLLTTLQSIRDQKTDRRFAVIVMENDAEERAGAHAATPLFQSGDVNGLLIIAHQRGNCHAYNAGWLTALVSFPNFRHLAVIDDDEVADPKWLENLCATREELDVDVVGGPQLPVFEDQNNALWHDHPVFVPHYTATGCVPALYSSGNLLVGRNVLEAMEHPFLDLRFNFLGGGDSDFLSRASARGFRFAWCAEALIHEDVPQRRTSWRWIQARALRNGVISTFVEKRRRADETFGQFRTVLKSLALLARAPFQAIVRLVTSGSVLVALYPVHVAIGRVLAEVGYVNEQYRQPENN